MTTKLGRALTCDGGTPTSKSCDFLITWPLEKCKTFYLHYCSSYDHKTGQSGNLRWGDHNFKVTWPFDYAVTWQIKKTYI